MGAFSVRWHRDGKDGDNSVRIDLDNEADVMLYDYSGTKLRSGAVTSTVSMYDGITDVSELAVYDVQQAVGVTSATISNRLLTVAGMTAAKGSVTVKGTYNGIVRTAVLSLVMQKGGVKYEILPSYSSVQYDPNTDILSPPQVTIDIYRTDDTGSREKLSSSNEECKLQYYDAEAWIDITGGILSINKKWRQVQLRLTNPKGDVVYDSETLPVVTLGKDGEQGENAYIVDLDNEMDAIPCDSSGYLSSQRQYKLQLSAFYGSTLVDIREISPTVKDCNGNVLSSGISVSTINLKEPVVTVPAGTYNSSPYTVAFKCTNDYGERTVVFTLVAQKAGANGETPTIYQLAPSHTSLSYTRDSNGTLTGSKTLTCKVKKTVGTSTTEIETGNSTGYYIYCGYDGIETPTTDFGSGQTISASNAASHSSVVLELWKGQRQDSSSVRLDRETIPILKDGYKGNTGTPGDDGVDATIAWLSCPYVAIPCHQNGKPKINTFTVNAYKRTGNNPAELTDDSYSLSYEVQYKSEDKNPGDDEGNSYNTLIVALDTSKVLVGVTIELKYGGVAIYTLSLKPVLDGETGSAGYNYLPQLVGIYDPTKTYTWSRNVRPGVLWNNQGVWYMYWVRNVGTTVPTNTPPSDGGNSHWEQASRYYTIFTEALYAQNASIGGFMISDKMFVSSEVSYSLTYRGKPITYRGLYNNSNIYYSNNVVYYNGNYYIAKAYIRSGSSYSPGSNANWQVLLSDSEYGSYIIKMCSGETTTGTTSVTVCCYVDNTSNERPFIYYNNAFWVPTANANGKIGTNPSLTSSLWRQLFPSEMLMLGLLSSSGISSGDNPFEYDEGKVFTCNMPTYLLNGKEGTAMMMQRDDTVWTYDMTGKQTLGVPYGNHIEIDPKDGKLKFFGNTGEQSCEVSGEEVSAVSDLVGTSGSGISNQSLTVKYNGNGTIGRRVTTEDVVGSSFTLTGNGAMTVSSTITLNGSQWKSTSPSGGGASVGVGPLPSGTPVEGGGYLFTNTISAYLMLQKQDSDGGWSSYVGVASSQNGTSPTILARTYTSQRTLNVTAGTYRIILRCEYSVYANPSYEVKAIASGVYASITSFVNLHRFFGNGFAFGSASDNFFAAVNESNYMRIKALTNAGKYGLELDKDNGLLATRNSFQGKVPILVYYGFITDNGSDELPQETKYSFDGGKLKCTRMGDGDYQLTIPFSWSDGGMSFYGGNLIPTIICKTTTTGVSAQINELGSNYIRVITANDNGVDNSNLIVKLEYIG